MSNKKDIHPVVCIPIYKSDLSKYELISIKSHIFKLKSHDIYILLPKSKTQNIISTLNKNNIYKSFYKIHQVEDYCLNGIINYNNLLLNIEFYEFYKSYSHILIAQMDAYTFSDQLIKWCNSDWDYIGAPIYYWNKYSDPYYFCCGDGGFNLRSITKTIEVIQKNPIIYKFDDFKIESKKYSIEGKIVLFLKFLATKLLRKDRIQRPFINSKLEKLFIKFYIFINEDVTYGKFLPKYFPYFKVANFDDSIKFSIASKVTESLQILDFQLPFGAHAWWRNEENLNAWEKYIK